MEYKFISGFQDAMERKMEELSKERWWIEHIDMTQDIIRVLMQRVKEANPPDHPSVSSLG